MRLVHNQEVVGSRESGLIACWKSLSKEAHRAITLEEVNGRDEAREVRPWVYVNAASATQVSEKVAVHDAEV